LEEHFWQGLLGRVFVSFLTRKQEICPARRAAASNVQFADDTPVTNYKFIDWTRLAVGSPSELQLAENCISTGVCLGGARDYGLMKPFEIRGGKADGRT